MRNTHRRSSAILALGTAVLISAGSSVIGQRNPQSGNTPPPVEQRSGIAVQEATPKMEQNGLTASNLPTTL
jgi:hypothetical protein